LVSKLKDKEAAVVSFFSLCHAAELGTTTVGKRGQPARLRVDSGQLGEFLRSPINEDRTSLVSQSTGVPLRRVESLERVYVSAGRCQIDVTLLGRMLALASFESVECRRPVGRSGLLTNPHLQSMAQCQAAVLLIGAEDYQALEDGDLVLSNERLAELNVALALFQQNVIIVCIGTDETSLRADGHNLHLLFCDKFDLDASVRIASLLKEIDRARGPLPVIHDNYRSDDE